MTLNDKKAAKKLIKIAKLRPEYYTQAEVTYARIIKKRLKQNDSKTSTSNSWRWKEHGVYRQSFKSKQSG